MAPAEDEDAETIIVGDEDLNEKAAAYIDRILNGLTDDAVKVLRLYQTGGWESRAARLSLQPRRSPEDITATANAGDTHPHFDGRGDSPIPRQAQQIAGPSDDGLWSEVRAGINLVVLGRRRQQALTPGQRSSGPPWRSDY